MTDRSSIPRERSRLRLRYSVRTLLLLSVVLSIWLAVQTNRARRQVAAVNAIERRSGEVRYDYEPTRVEEMTQTMNAADKGLPPPTYADEPDGPRWLRRLVGDEYFERVVDVKFMYCKVDEPMLENFSSLPDLENLSLMHSDVSDSDLRGIGKLTGLRMLGISGHQISDAGLVHLYSLQRLERLTVSNNTGVTPAGAARLQEHLPNCQITIEEPLPLPEPMRRR